MKEFRVGNKMAEIGSFKFWGFESKKRENFRSNLSQKVWEGVMYLLVCFGIKSNNSNKINNGEGCQDARNRSKRARRSVITRRRSLQQILRIEDRVRIGQRLARKSHEKEV